MTSTPSLDSKPSSRRAMLAGALGAVGTFAASAIGRPSAALGHDVDDVRLGGANVATTTTELNNPTTDSDVLRLLTSGAGAALVAQGTAAGAIRASTIAGPGPTVAAIFGDSQSADPQCIAIWGRSFDNTGVYGQSTSKDGVSGAASGDGNGVHGKAGSGWAGYFEGKVLTTKYHEMVGITTPSAPAANRARLFVRVNTSGKTQLCVRFPNGAVKVLAAES
jgi:hypothetical protein